MADVEDLTDEQMQILLENAEARMQQRGKESSSSIAEYKPFKFPQLSTGELAKPHTRPGHHGGVVMQRSSEQPEGKAVASLQMRKVEDPVLVRKRQSEVRVGILALANF